MDHYAGIDVSLECSSVCVVDANGKIVRDAKVASEPEEARMQRSEMRGQRSRIALRAIPATRWGTLPVAR
jgi:hypothetical protein